MANPFVSTDGTKFSLGGQVFPVAGVNCYFLGYCAAASQRAAMLAAKEMGGNAIRTWAFADTEAAGGVAFQYLENGVIKIDDGPNGLQRLDGVIQTAEELGLKLILPLVNHWKDFGGMPMYLKWLGIAGDVKNFYGSLDARLAYRNWVRSVLTRRNSLTGRLYSEEPSIMAWELTNEARCEGDRDMLLDWVHEMASYVKQLDGNHLLALGDEGFFREGFFEHLFAHRKGELYDGRHGTDFAAVLDIPEIDFGGYHFYPQDWGHGNDLEFGEQWVKDHAEAGERAGKPVLMEEYGLKVGDAVVPDGAARKAWFERWLQAVKETGTAGSLLWMLGGSEADTSGYKDAYVVYKTDEVPMLS